MFCVQHDRAKLTSNFKMCNPNRVLGVEFFKVSKVFILNNN